MSALRVKFVDDYCPFSEGTCYLYDNLRRHFDLEVTEDPDYLFYSVFGYEHSNPRYDRCVRIWHTGENIRPDFDRCDYALSCDYLEGDPRYLRLPEYVRSHGERASLLVKPLLLGSQRVTGPVLGSQTLGSQTLGSQTLGSQTLGSQTLGSQTLGSQTLDAEVVLASKTRFCNFLYTNDRARTRVRFFQALSKYKQVDSGGTVLNNMGRVVPNNLTDKLTFLSQYKFTIAFENVRYPGYTTEKLVDPMLAGSIPIYWGNWQVGREFNTRSFVCCHEYESFEDVIEEIVRLDRDGGRYIAKMKEPWLLGNTPNEHMRLEYLISFFGRVFATTPHAYPRWSGVSARDHGLRTSDHSPEYEPPSHLIEPPEYRVFE